MISQVLIRSLEEAVSGLFRDLAMEAPADFEIHVEQPAHWEHGDYSTNVAMKLGKRLRKSPLQIAEMLKSKLSPADGDQSLVRRIEIVAPGFINLFIDWRQWARRNFTTPSGDGEKIVIEHTSINPNKSAHIGHLRNACIGDTLVRMLRRVGFPVEVHNYIDDLGNQLADTVVAMLHTPHKGNHSRFGDFCWDIYSKVNKAYVDNPQMLDQRAKVLHSLEEADGNLSWLGLLVAERIVREHLEDMNEFGIHYDLLVWESQIVQGGFWASAFGLLKQTPLFYRETAGKLEGCWVLKQPGSVSDGKDDATDDHSADKVLVRSNGILTYTAKDIAYHLWKFGLLDEDFGYQRFTDGLWTTSHAGTEGAFGKAGKVINVIDYRQQYPQAMVKQALEGLGYARQAGNLHHVSYGVVSLSPATAEELGIDTSDRKKSYAMSGRQGIGVKVTDLLERMEGIIEQRRSDRNGLSSRDIAAASIRYYLLRFSLLTEVVFDLEQATETTGNTGVYLMYAYARACGVLNKTAAESTGEPVIPDDFGQMDKVEYILLRHIATWQDILHEACRELSPTSICQYAHELATMFNNFYALCPILKTDGEQKIFRVWLTYQFRQTIGDALSVLGLPTPARM